MVLGKRWLFLIRNGAKIRPLEMGRKGPGVILFSACPSFYHSVLMKLCPSANISRFIFEYCILFLIAML